MSINVTVTDGTTGGINTNVVKVITQTTENNNATVNAEPNKGYILTGVALQTINMPDDCVIGDVFALHGKGTGLFKIAQRAGEQILFGNTPSTVGVTGSVESTHQNDSIYLICTDSAGVWTPDNGTFGTFLIDGVTLNNAINNVGGGIALTSPENNVAIGGAAPNITLDVGKTTAGLRTLVINNLAPAAHADDSVAFGDSAGSNNQANRCVAIGANAGKNDQSVGAIAIGRSAGATNQGNNCIAIGNQAGGTSQKNECVAIGLTAGFDTQGLSAVAIGDKAARSIQGQFAVSIGCNSGELSQGSESVAIGHVAGNDHQGSNCVAVGRLSGEITQGANSVAVGVSAGNDSQGTESISVGHNAGKTSQGINSVAMGSFAGQLTQGANSVAIGYFSGNDSQGTNCVAVGNSAGKTTQGLNSVSVGVNAGETTQGTNSVAVGSIAGQETQGIQSVAVGSAAGNSLQGSSSVAVGANAGAISQGDMCVAVGRDAGANNQANRCIAVGRGAGANNQGQDSICIGDSAGGAAVLAFSIQIGSGCVPAGVIGRLAFGSQMEAITALGTVTAVQTGWENQEWNGVHVRLPVFPAGRTAPLFTPQHGFVQMENNLWTGRDFAFTSAFTELLPTAATYHSDVSANFTNPSNAVIKYVGAESKTLKVTAFYTADVSEKFAIAIGVNGLVDVNSENYIDGDSAHLSLARTFNQNDEITIMATRNAGATKAILSLGLIVAE